MIFVPLEGSDDEDDDNDNDDEGEEEDDGSSSSSDENDSTAAAHAAAIGHSPQPIRPTLEVPDNEANVAQSSSSSPEKQGEDVLAESPAGSTPGEAAEATTKTTDNSSPMDVEGEDSKKPEAETNHNQAPEAPTQNGGEKKLPKQQKKKQRKYYCPHNLNERDDDENTPIHVAIHSRKLECVRLLLEAGASVHKKSDGSPPVHTAISIGALPQHEQFGYDCLVLLSEFEADLSAKDDAMHTPLYLACQFNLPNIARFLLSTEGGSATLNTKADRSGGRPLHTAAKFDFSTKSFMGRTPASSMGARPVPHRHHPDGSVPNSMHHIPGFPGKLEANANTQGTPQTPGAQPAGGASEATTTQILLGTEGIEVDALNTVGQTPLHIACMRGNWVVARLLLQAGADPNIADRRGFTPGQLAHKRGMAIPIDLINVLGGPPSSGTVAPPRDLIVDPDGTTLMLSHELCVLHRSCPPIVRNASQEAPPENVRRLQVLIDQDTGILRCGEFGKCVWEGESRRAAMVDVLKVSSFWLLYFFFIPMVRFLSDSKFFFSGYSLNVIVSRI